MTQLSLTVKAPGKLMIAGEYAVLEEKQKSVVIAVDRYVTVCIKESNKNSISIPKMGLENITWQINNKGIRFNVDDSRLRFIENSISIAIKFLRENLVRIKPFKLHIKSELDDPSTNKKYGLGSSAAIVVSVISAVFKLHINVNKLLSLDKIFKLSAIAHLKTQKNGSGADIAAAVYGGWIEYSTFSTKWILNKLKQEEKLTQIINESWPNLLINKLVPPSFLKLVVGWTKQPASTALMVKKFQNFKERNPEAYNEFLRESSISVDRLIDSFSSNDYEKAIDSLKQNRKVLQKLDNNSGMPIETEKLRVLCDIAEKFGSGKSSGAGGGDCGIAFLKSEEKIQELYKLWEAVDIMPLNLSVSNNL